MIRTPDEIKKGLECCVNDMEPGDECEGCPYFEKLSRFHWICRDDKVWSDALALIQQLEAERDAAIHDMHEAQSIVCLICKNYYQPDPAVKKYGCKEFGEHWLEDGGAIVCGKFEWRGVQKEDDDA